MTEPVPVTPLSWVHKRDGRLVPFDPDKISRALFSATESVGSPDAFLARELTDGVLHFLAADADGSILTTTQVAETVVQVVRELGQPVLAQAFAAQVQQRRVPGPRPAPQPPTEAGVLSWEDLRQRVAAVPPARELAAQVSRACLQEFALREVFARDLVAAHTHGLLRLGGLDAPLELASCVATPGSAATAAEDVRDRAGAWVVFDAPEYAPSGTEAHFPDALAAALAGTGLRAVVNLNGAVPPTWASQPEGPLFASQPGADPDRRQAQADLLLEQCLSAASSDRARIDWHLSERDFLPAAAARLQRLLRRASDGAALSFVFDRPGKPVALAEGMTRRHPAVLLTVAVDLDRLAEQPRVGGDPAVLLQKLGSLARLALSAAVQKRDFLRRCSDRRPTLARGFLLERARLVVVPLGLEAVTRRLCGHGPSGDRAALEFACSILRRLRTVLHQDSQGRQLDACLDGPASFHFEDNPARPPVGIAGLTAWDAAAPPRQQVRAASALHAEAQHGTAALQLPDDVLPKAETLVDLLHRAWKSDVVRLRLLRRGAPPRQLTAPWAE